MSNRNAGALFAAMALAALFAWAQSDSAAVIVNRAGANWVHEKRDPPGSESVVLREDRISGALELLVNYSAGHTFAPHWHESNERIVLLEGQLSLGSAGAAGKLLNPGGYAYLPARELQRLSCASKTRCVFYVAWDGSPRSHRDVK